MTKMFKLIAGLMILGAVSACAPPPPGPVILVQPTLYEKDGTPIASECPDGYIPGTNVNECVPYECEDGYIPGTNFQPCPPPRGCPPGQTYNPQTMECIPIGGQDPDPTDPDPQNPFGGQTIRPVN